MTVGVSRPLDEKVWKDWLAKNRKQEEAQFARNLKLALIVAPFAMAAILFFVWLR